MMTGRKNDVWLNFLKGREKTSYSRQLTNASSPWESRLDRVDNLSTLTQAAAKVYAPDAYSGVTEFTGIVVHVQGNPSLRNPSEDPATSNTPIEAAKAGVRKYILKCYSIDGPQSIFQTIPTDLAKVGADADLDVLFAGWPGFVYDLDRVPGNRIPKLGDEVILKFNNEEMTRGICIKHLNKNHFEKLFSLNEGKSLKDQFSAATSNNVADYSSTPVPRASPPKWNKPCLNDQDPKYSASSLRASRSIKNLIKSWTTFVAIPYDRNKPKGWQTGLTSYDSPTVTPAIGWGHLIKTAERSEFPIKVPIDRVEGEKIFREDIRQKEIRLAKLIKVPITQNQFDALISFYYDVGVTIFRNKGSVLEHLNAGNCAAAAKAFLMFAPLSKGKERELYTKRRKYEASLFVSSYRGPSVIPPTNLEKLGAEALKRSQSLLPDKSSEMATWAARSGGYDEQG